MRDHLIIVRGPDKINPMAHFFYYRIFLNISTKELDSELKG